MGGRRRELDGGGKRGAENKKGDGRGGQRIRRGRGEGGRE